MSPKRTLRDTLTNKVQTACDALSTFSSKAARTFVAILWNLIGQHIFITHLEKEAKYFIQITKETMPEVYRDHHCDVCGQQDDRTLRKCINKIRFSEHDQGIHHIIERDCVAALNAICRELLKPRSFRFDNGDSLLHVACSRGSILVIKYLLAKGVDINGVSTSGEKPLLVAIRSGQLDAVKALINHFADPYNVDNVGSYAIHSAVFYDQPDILQFLLECGLNGNEPNQEGVFPILLAVSEQKENLALLLIKSGVDVNVVARNPIRVNVKTMNGNGRYSSQIQAGGGILHIVAKMYPETNMNAVAMLAIKHGVDVNLMDDRECTALYYALCSSNTTLIRALLKNDADVDLSCPLIPAINSRRVSLVRKLIKRGARLDVSTEHSGKNAYYELSTHEWIRVPSYSPLTAACAIGCPETVRLILENGANPNFVPLTESGRTVLHHAVVHSFYGPRNDDILKELLIHGANANILDSSKETPLMRAVKEKYSSAVVILLQHGAMVSKKMFDHSSEFYNTFVDNSPFLEIFEDLFPYYNIDHTQSLDHSTLEMVLLFQPKSLQKLVRHTIRLALGGGDVPKKLDSLVFLPSVLRKFLKLSHLDELKQPPKERPFVNLSLFV